MKKMKVRLPMYFIGLKATILFHVVLVLIQILLLRKNFKPVQLLQIPVGIITKAFGRQRDQLLAESDDFEATEAA